MLCLSCRFLDVHHNCISYDVYKTVAKHVNASSNLMQILSSVEFVVLESHNINVVGLSEIPILDVE